MSFLTNRRGRRRKKLGVSSWVGMLLIGAGVVYALLAPAETPPRPTSVNAGARATAIKPRATAIKPKATTVKPKATAIKPTAPNARATAGPTATLPGVEGCFPGSEALVAGELNIREGASASARLLGTTPPGERYKVAASRQGTDYCWIDIGLGWIAATEFVSGGSARASAPAQAPEPASPKPAAPAGKTCYRGKQAWVSGNMNVREQPGTDGRIVGSTRAGQRFDVLDSRTVAPYCWLRISTGWMAKTDLVSATQPQQRAPGLAGGGAAASIAALNAMVVAPENRCSAYVSGDYSYPQSLELDIIQRMGGRIYGPYTGSTFGHRGETDIEHIVAKSEAHDSGLCAAGKQTRKTFARDLLNLTLASPSVNRDQKSGKDFAEWRPARNRCWFADTIIKVKTKYRLTVDSREKAALEATLRNCGSVGMIFANAASPPAQPAQPAQPAPPANANTGSWDSDGNGRVNCADARALGIAPVRRGHPMYSLLRDPDGDGVTCE